MTTGLRVEKISKAFDGAQALRGVSLEVARGAITAVLGPSGCGKTTLLNIIAGLTPPDEGAVFWDDEPLADLPPHQRSFGLMFQEFALFPHMNVAQNIAFGLRMQGLNEDDIQARVTEMLNRVRLRGYERRSVDTLSGGERQRVALARALAPRPRLLMLDEPLGALDRTLREQLLLELPQLLRQLQQTALYVTHDQEEAFAFADCIAIMNEGRVEQVGTPEQIYGRPASAFVARFLGMENLLKSRVGRCAGKRCLKTPIGDIPYDHAAQGDLQVLLRPDRVRIGSDGAFALEGKLIERSFRGPFVRVVVEINGERLTFDVPVREPIPPLGETVMLSFDPEEALQVLP